MQDTRLFRQAFKNAGFLNVRPWLPLVFNDKHKDGTTRRLKLWFGDHIFDASQVAQEELERQFKALFGGRYLFGQFIAKGGYHGGGKAFCVYLLTA